MASADQQKALLKFHLEGDDERFFSVAMQVAAHEAKLGHSKLAEESRALIDLTKARRGLSPQGKRKAIPISRPRGGGDYPGWIVGKRDRHKGSLHSDL